jgi:phosphoenolpyruvate carboxylase
MASSASSATARASTLLQQFLPHLPELQSALSPSCSSSSSTFPASASDEKDPAFLAPLTKDIEYLTAKLFNIIAQQDGAEVADTVRQLVAVSKQYRERNDLTKFQELVDRVHELITSAATAAASTVSLGVTAGQTRNGGEPAPFNSNGSSDLPRPLLSKKVLQVARAFHELLALANVAESHHRIRRWRNYLRGSGQLVQSQKQQPSDVFVRLKEAGFTPQQISQHQSEQKCDFVLTAHPTQATRRTLLAKYQSISTLLGVRERTDLTPAARGHLEEAFDREILAAWHSNTVRRVRPTPQDEARAGLAVVEDTLWHAVPIFLQSVDDALKDIGAQPVPPEVSTVRISSWMGQSRNSRRHLGRAAMGSLTRSVLAHAP